MKRINEPFELQAYITNLGRYNAGELIGTWVTFPVSNEEMQKVFDEIEINEYNEEWFVTDYDGNLPKGIYDALGEYPSLNGLNKLALLLDKINELGPDAREKFEALCNETTDYFCAGENVLYGNLTFLEGVEDMSDVARYYINEFGYDGIKNLEFYIEYEELGKLIDMEYNPDRSMPETAAEYWCGNEDATYEEIGEAVIEAIGFEGLSNPEYFFNFEMYGETLESLGSYTFTETGCIDMDTYNETLGDELRDELQDEIDAMNEEYDYSRDDDDVR